MLEREQDESKSQLRCISSCGKGPDFVHILVNSNSSKCLLVAVKKSYTSACVHMSVCFTIAKYPWDTQILVKQF